MLFRNCLHYSQAGIARRRLWPDSACVWLNPAVFPFCAFFSPPLMALHGSLPGAIPLNPGGRHTAAIPLKLQHGAGAGLRYSPVLCSRHKISIFSALFVLFALCMLTSCDLSNQPKLPKPRFKTPINLSHKGVVADFDIRVTWHRIYHFDIRFEYPEEDQAERERVRKLVGGYGRDKDNNLIEPGILTPVKLTIFKKQKQGELMIYQKIIKDPETYAGGSGSFAKHIGRCDLKRGEYRFVLESLAQPQEYASIPTNFIVTFNGILEARLIFINVDRSKTCPQ